MLFRFPFLLKNSKRNTKKHQWFYNSVKTKQRITGKQGKNQLPPNLSKNQQFVTAARRYREFLIILIFVNV